MTPKTASTFDLLKRKDPNSVLDHLRKQAAIDDTLGREKPLSKTYQPLLSESLMSVGNTELWNRIKSCSNHPTNLGHRYSGVCQSPWCIGCRNHLYFRHWSKVHNRLAQGNHLKVQYEDPTPLLFTETKEKFQSSPYTNGDLKHITGVVGICPVRSRDVENLIKQDTTKWRRIKRRLHKETEQNYWIEAVYELELVRWDKLKLAPESDYKKLQMEMLIRHHGQRYQREPFLFVHFHGLTNLQYQPLIRVFGSEYWLQPPSENRGNDGIRIPKTNPQTGLYIQGLHKDKTLEQNIKKITSYPFKNPTRYKHSFIGSDYQNGEFFESEELGRLMSVYDDFIGRQGRAIFRSLTNDAEYWHNLIQLWMDKLKGSHRRWNRENAQRRNDLAKLLRRMKWKRVTNVEDLFLPLIEEQLLLHIQKKNPKNPTNKFKENNQWVAQWWIRRKREKVNQLPWKFQPVGLSGKEKAMIRRYQAETNNFWNPITHKDLPEVYQHLGQKLGWSKKSKDRLVVGEYVLHEGD